MTTRQSRSGRCLQILVPLSIIWLVPSPLGASSIEDLSPATINLLVMSTVLQHDVTFLDAEADFPSTALRWMGTVSDTGWNATLAGLYGGLDLNASYAGQLNPAGTVDPTNATITWTSSGDFVAFFGRIGGVQGSGVVRLGPVWDITDLFSFGIAGPGIPTISAVDTTLSAIVGSSGDGLSVEVFGDGQGHYQRRMDHGDIHFVLATSLSNGIVQGDGRLERLSGAIVSSHTIEQGALDGDSVVGSIAVAPTAIPEPATWMLVLSAGAFTLRLRTKTSALGR
jgi:hypothetical protein